MAKCRVADCGFEGPLLLEMCSRHYQRWYRYGSIDHPANNPVKIEQRILKKVSVTGELGCWEWQGVISAKGYGRMYAYGKPQQVHRLSYKLYLGDIPEGMVVDHKYVSQGCPRHCVNPDHLQVATPKENQENLSGVRKNNSTGFRGVHQDKRTKKWTGRLNHNYKTYTKGGFATAEEANIWVIGKRNSLYTHNYADRLDKEKLNVEA